MKLPLVGQSYTSRSLAFSAQSAINVYAELNDDAANQKTVLDPGHAGKNRAALYGAPGRHLLSTLAGNVRCVWTGGGRSFVVAGALLSEVTQDGTATARTG